MSHTRDTDYLSISTRIHAMENRMLTRERMERMIDAKEDSEVLKLLSECGYGGTDGLQLNTVDEALSTAQAATFQDLRASVPDQRLLDVFQLKYDYHNAKTLVKAEGMGIRADHLLMSGGRYAPTLLADGFHKGELRGLSDLYCAAITKAKETLAASHDPQLADLVLDRAYFAEMTQLAKDSGSAFLQGYVRLCVDIANLRTAVRVARMEKSSDFLSQVLIPGGNVSETQLARTRGEDLEGLFRSGALAKAAELGSAVARPASGSLTAFERECDNALTNYLSSARRVPFGEETVIGYLYAKEAELTTIRTILAGRKAGLDGNTIRERLRESYV